MWHYLRSDSKARKMGEVGEEKKKSDKEAERQRKKKITACRKQAHKPNRIKADWRKDGGSRVL